METETMETTAEADCRIYVACLASYNAGTLHGRWIDVDDKDGDEIAAEVAEMLRGSPYPNVTRVQCKDCSHIQDYRENDTCDECGGDLGKPFPSAEEWAIHDHEGFGNMVGEYTSFDDVAAIAEALNGDHALGFRWLVEDRGCSVDEAARQADEVQIYQADVHDLAADYAQELFEDMGTREERNRLSQWPFNCIDWERAGRDLVIGGDVDEANIGGERFLVTNASEF
jgi:antirestriction protein